MLLSSVGGDVIMTRMHPVKERNIIKKFAVLYDNLAAAVDEINSIFSNEVSLNIATLIFIHIFPNYFR